jgi:hypothetical protein
MKKIVFKIALTGLTLWLLFKGYTLYKLIVLGPNYRAKLYCSCRFVTQQTPDFCENWTRSPLLPSFLIPLKVDEGKKQVVVENFLSRAQANYAESTEGCRLQ